MRFLASLSLQNEGRFLRLWDSGILSGIYTLLLCYLGYIKDTATTFMGTYDQKRCRWVDWIARYIYLHVAFHPTRCMFIHVNP
jgi:hypothetical protein